MSPRIKVERKEGKMEGERHDGIERNVNPDGQAEQSTCEVEC